MKRLLITAILMVTTVMTITAQTALKKVYNENIDPMELTRLLSMLRPKANM